MSYQSMYWNLFTQSGDPEAYLAYKRQSMTGQPSRPGEGNRPDRPRGGGFTPPDCPA